MGKCKEIDAFFDAHQDEMVKEISNLISIESVRGPTQKGAPFGPGPARALDAAADLARRLGLRVRELEHYVVTADIGGPRLELGILAHLDVVAAGEGWTFPPFKGTLRAGKIYGRGAIDDKGPVVAA